MHPRTVALSYMGPAWSVSTEIFFYVLFPFMAYYLLTRLQSVRQVVLLILGMAGIDAAREMHGIDVGGERPRAEVALWTDDVDAAYEQAVAGGARPLAAPHDFLGSVRAAWVADPEGNPVELVMRRKG